MEVQNVTFQFIMIHRLHNSHKNIFIEKGKVIFELNMCDEIWLMG